MTILGVLAMAVGPAVVIGYDRLHPVDARPTSPPSTYAVRSPRPSPGTPQRATATHPAGAPSRAKPTTAKPPVATSTPAPSPAGDAWDVLAAPADVAASFADATSGLGLVGAAYAVVGRGGTIRTVGTWRAGPAWSTAKVPLAVAALRRSTEGTHHLIEAALTRSDNAAAEALWAGLGGGDAAARQVDSQLRRLDDPITRTQARRVRPPYTPFGQTRWSLDAQVRFAAALSCSRDPLDRDIVATMGHVVAEQHWGLGRLESAAFKGGWGPDPAGRYLVRQFGLVQVAGIPVAVALAVEPTDGSFDSGVRALGVVASWVARSGESGTLPTTPC